MRPREMTRNTKQAELTGRRLAQYLPEGVEWKRIHQSDMIRCELRIRANRCTKHNRLSAYSLVPLAAHF